MGRSGMLLVAACLFLSSLQLLQAHGHGRRQLLSSPPNSSSSTDNNHAIEQQLVVVGNDSSNADGGQQQSNYACNYHFQVKTGDMDYAGTDGKITFGVSRQDGSGWWTVVDSSGTFYGNIFEQGSLDALDFNGWCMHPCKLTIHNNGAGFFPDWYLEWVHITVTGDIYDDQTFYLNDWIGPWSPHGNHATIDYCQHHHHFSNAL